MDKYIIALDGAKIKFFGNVRLMLAGLNKEELKDLLIKNSLMGNNEVAAIISEEIQGINTDKKRDPNKRRLTAEEIRSEWVKYQNIQKDKEESAVKLAQNIINGGDSTNL